MNSTDKYIGEVYRVQEIATNSLWYEKRHQLIGYRGELQRQGTNHFYALKMMEGPYMGQVISIYGARLKAATKQTTCRCAAYTFPHRAGSGACPTATPLINEHLEGKR